MNISAKIILDSISHSGARLTTLQLCYPRFIHSEFMTHRMFSRNAASSRAIPVARMIEQVRNDPATPVHWGRNQPGMQARGELDEFNRMEAEHLWAEAAFRAADFAEKMSAIGLHKQVANRILEPFQWMHTIVTATDWDNFFTLRLHPDAEPNIQELARCMKEAMGESMPVERDYHAPYMGDWQLGGKYTLGDWRLGGKYTLGDLAMISAARCARVSYLNHDGSSPDPEKDLDLARKLKESGHASPFEHVAGSGADYPKYFANFRGWKSFRYEMGI